MSPFLVKGTVYRTHYMDDTTSFEDIRLVMANDTAEALQKFMIFGLAKRMNTAYIIVQTEQ